ncbi:hypothetical protein Hbl1158_04500 [Halobaculum sp. CBA1158]|uniref:hypothetical protein n=1 Tax=Halobaculum sp. CBA1158 TaxID=2904243 RepID=UPI001F2C023F|nr:hypothetical protein [Halobaculum sp. CBA1158]UIP00627.1 hypothetical protein Hbl1158_04500 [Halobaculum sp. CBA1158]
MNEERVTEAVEAHLTREGWTMFAVDYPTSGSGLRLHPADRADGTKHGGSIVPDVVAYRERDVLVVESKPYFDVDDARKLREVADGRYAESLDRRVYAVDIDRVYTALAFPASDADAVRSDVLDGVDRLLLVDADGDVTERRV